MMLAPKNENLQTSDGLHRFIDVQGARFIRLDLNAFSFHELNSLFFCWCSLFSLEMENNKFKLLIKLILI